MRENRRGRKVIYRPSKAHSVMSGVVGCIFVLFGLFVAIPTFGLFGIFWTVIAVAIAGTSLYQAFGKGYIGPEIHVEDDDGVFSSPGVTGVGSAEQRLAQLRSLYDQRLITEAEYEQKRKQIIQEL